ncbi:MAG: hypothetical protein NW237_00975 [Cyanobacteriota bacterium]|nr:hypothetical protein [Cyanobacteriota bacterium]
MMTYTAPKTSTTEMEVTSIRLERELKDRLKVLAGDQGYQALVREVLWNYVYHHSLDLPARHSQTDIRATIPATARQSECCALTGEVIAAQSDMLLGLTHTGEWIPLSLSSLENWQN